MESIAENLNFTTIHNLKWHPFIGENYFSTSKDNRLLIIGESHYTHDTEESKLTVNHIDFTKEMIQENAIDGEDWKTKIIPNFHKAMFGDNSFNTDKFWNLVSYYNFIQRPMLTIGERPNENDFQDGWKTFFDLIKVVKPKTCLFIGVSASNHLMSVIQNSDFSCKEFIYGEVINGTKSRKATLLDKENNEIEIVFIKHSSQYFSWNDWNEYLKNEIGDQLFWFEKNINIAEAKITKQKLKEVYETINTKLFDYLVDKIKIVAPTKSGEYSDCFTLIIDVNKYSFAYEVAIENLGFCSYHWDTNTKQQIPLLIEKEIKGLSFAGNKTSKEISAEIVEDILKIISILKLESK